MSVSIPGPALEILTFAFFDMTEATLLRKLRFRPRENSLGMDLPGLNRCHTLLKRYTPVDPQKDPYIVALVIALAQKERRHRAQPLPPSSSFTVRLLISSFLPLRTIPLYYPRSRELKSLTNLGGGLLGSHSLYWAKAANPLQSLRGPCSSLLS